MITMKEIAREAGVSQPAVSLVLNGRGQSSRISESTRERVLAAAGRLGYHRNELARAMKTGKTNIIGIVGALESGYSLEIIKGISEAATAASYTIKLLPAHDAASMAAVCRQCLEQRLDGVIVRSISQEEMDVLLSELSSYQVPMAFIGNILAPAEHLHITSDDYHGVMQAVTHLAGLGHRRIAFFDAPISPLTIRSRRQGFIDGMKQHGWDGEAMICDISLTESLRLPEMQTALKKIQPTAAVCVCDFTAMRLLQAATMNGMRVPDDLSVVGFGDLDFAKLANPPLTTIHQPFAALGQKAAELLFEKIAGRNILPETVLPVELVIRKSTAHIKSNR